MARVRRLIWTMGFLFPPPIANLANAMARLGLAKSGRTLGVGQGLAGLRPTDLAYKVRRGALTGASVLALLAGLAATGASFGGVAQHGVEGDELGGIRSVSPTGFAWRAGIRPGQSIAFAVGNENGPGEWRMETFDAAGRRHLAVEGSANAGLQATSPIGLAALALGGLAVIFLRTHRRWAAPVASVALLAAAIPLFQEGDPVASTGVMAAAILVPSAALVGLLHGRSRRLLLAILSLLVAGWALVRVTGITGGTEPDDLWNVVAVLATAGIVVERSVVPRMSGQSLGVLRPRISDLGVIAAIVLLGFLAATLSSGSWLPVAGVVALGLAAVPAARQRLGRPLEAALFADVREQAAAEATERERARLARELHDVPLQELVAVIRRLEIQPGAEAETEDLRALAGHLRNVATELRPPVLDDLGLPAALDYLAEQTSTSAVPVAATVDDRTGFGEERRPPTDVELAMFRIASEAVGNAVRHSGGSFVRIEASVAPDRVELVVADDGAGLAPEQAREAAKRKRLGLSSMRRRAEAIDAELSIDGSGRGTRVRAVWQA
jgi:signal transduction histidine kinase